VPKFSRKELSFYDESNNKKISGGKREKISSQSSLGGELVSLSSHMFTLRNKYVIPNGEKSLER